MLIVIISNFGTLLKDIFYKLHGCQNFSTLHCVIQILITMFLSHCWYYTYYIVIYLTKCKFGLSNFGLNRIPRREVSVRRRSVPSEQSKSIVRREERSAFGWDLIASEHPRDRGDLFTQSESVQCCWIHACGPWRLLHTWSPLPAPRCVYTANEMSLQPQKALILRASRRHFLSSAPIAKKHKKCIISVDLNS